MWYGYWSPENLSELVQWLEQRITNPLIGKNGAVLINFNVHTPPQCAVDELGKGLYYLPYFYSPAWKCMIELLGKELNNMTMVTYIADLEELREPPWFNKDITEDEAKNKLKQVMEKIIGECA